MKLTKILICLLIFWTGTLSASPYFSFKKYQVEDGLSHNTVWCALQDSYGFIWLGTSDGLNRYDGRGNKVYRNVLNEKFSLENNFVEALIEVDKNLWVGTNSGLIFMTGIPIVSLTLIKRRSIMCISAVRLKRLSRRKMSYLDCDFGPGIFYL